MNKLTKFLLFFLVAGVMSLFLVSCEEDYEDRLTGSNPEGNAVDVSNRISGFSSDVTGAGSTLTINGSNLSDVIRIRMGQLWIEEFEASESQVVLIVPANIGLGENEVTLVFSGNGRAKSSIEVIPVPSISYFTPKSASDGEEITLLGNNLTYVNALRLGDQAATITEQENGMLKFTVPSGAATNLISMTSTSGNVVTSVDSLVACSANPDNLACMPVINTNGSFEESNVGPADGVAGWGGINGSLVDGEITDEEYYDGFKSMKITINEIGSNPWNIQPTSTMTVNPNSTYHVSFWIKGSGIANAMFAVDEAGTPGYLNWQSPEVEVNSNEWTEISYTFTPTTEAPPNGDESMRFAISLSYEGNVGGVLYLDNLRVVELEEGAVIEPSCTYEEDPVCFCNDNPISSECTQLANGGFESGDENEFTNWSKFNGAALINATTDDANVYSGSRALMVTVDGSQGGDDQWRIQLASDAVTTEVDAQYIVTAWAKAEDEGGTIRFSTQPNALYGPDTPITTEWTQLQWTITANSEETQVVMDMGGAFNTTYYFDDVRLIKVP